MAARKEAIDRQILVKKRQKLGTSWDVPPIPHKIHCDGKHAHRVHASSTHSIVGVVGNALVEGARRFRVGPYLITSVFKRKRQKGGAYLCEQINQQVACPNGSGPARFCLHP